MDLIMDWITELLASAELGLGGCNQPTSHTLAKSCKCVRSYCLANLLLIGQSRIQWSSADKTIFAACWIKFRKLAEITDDASCLAVTKLASVPLLWLQWLSSKRI